MKGRTLFRKAKFFLFFLIKVTRLLPSSVSYFFLSIIRNFPGKIGIACRYILVSALAKKYGENISIHTNVVLKNISNISFGNNISIHSFNYIDGSGGLSIGNDVSIAHSSSILTTDHTWTDIDIPIKYNPTISKPVTIKNNIWIGCGVRILGGVEIEDRAIVAAGAVVNKSVKSNTLVGGIPAKVIKSI